MLGAARAKARDVTSIRVGSSALLGQLFIWSPMNSETACLDSDRRFMDWFLFISSSCGKPEIRLRGFGIGVEFYSFGLMKYTREALNRKFDIISNVSRRFDCEGLIMDRICLTSKVSREHGWRISCCSEHEM